MCAAPTGAVPLEAWQRALPGKGRSDTSTPSLSRVLKTLKRREEALPIKSEIRDFKCLMYCFLKTIQDG